MRKLGLLLITILMLTACSDPPQSGYIYKKTYLPAWDQWDTHCISYNKKGFCSMSMPYIIHHPEYFYLCLADDKDPKYTGCLTVPESMWNKYDVKQHYPDPK